MKLEDYRSTYYTLSGKASDVSRQLSFAGIALIWIFKAEKGGPLAVPEPLLLPAELFVIALGLDLMQYVFGTIIWGAYARYHEGRQTPESEELLAPMYFNWPTGLCFWLKLLTVSAGYVFVLTYIASLLAKA